MSIELQLLSIINNIKILFEELLLLSSRELDLLKKIPADEDISDSLNSLTEARQDLIDRIDKEKKNIIELEKQAGVSPADSDKYAEYLSAKKEISKIIHSIQEKDQESRKILSRLVQETGTHLGKVKTNKKALNQYNRVNSYPDAWFFDRKK